MNTAPLVSILIPCYNHATFLPDILTSLMQQDYPNIELLICDDCSPDDSYTVLQHYENQLRHCFKRVEILRNEKNCGVTVNINRMLRMAQGEYIKVIASDDAMTPNAISSMIAYFQEHPKTDIVIANGQKVSEEDRYPNFTNQGLIYTQAPTLTGPNLFERIAAYNDIFAPGAMLRAQVFTQHGLYDESLAVEDLEFWLRLLRTERVHFGYIHTPLIYYRINENSMTSTVFNPALEQRRMRFHHAIIQTFEKFRQDFSKGICAKLVITRILDEMSFAIDSHMEKWESQLKKQLQNFHAHRELSLSCRVHLFWRYTKMLMRKKLKLRR